MTAGPGYGAANPRFGMIVGTSEGKYVDVDGCMPRPRLGMETSLAVFALGEKKEEGMRLKNQLKIALASYDFCTCCSQYCSNNLVPAGLSQTYSTAQRNNST